MTAVPDRTLTAFRRAIDDQNAAVPYQKKSTSIHVNGLSLKREIALWRGGQQSKQDDGYTATGQRQFQCRTPCRLASSAMYLQGIPPVSPGVNQTVSVASSLTTRSDFPAIADSTRSAKTGKQTAATASQSSPLIRTLLM